MLLLNVGQCFISLCHSLLGYSKQLQGREGPYFALGWRAAVVCWEVAVLSEGCLWLLSKHSQTQILRPSCVSGSPFLPAQAAEKLAASSGPSPRLCTSRQRAQDTESGHWQCFVPAPSVNGTGLQGKVALRTRLLTFSRGRQVLGCLCFGIIFLCRAKWGLSTLCDVRSRNPSEYV